MNERFTIVDDGTFDYVVFDKNRGRTHRFDHEFYVMFNSDEDFLKSAVEFILEDEAEEM